jgi:tRNA (guanine26-N2/guanine27-N2)-dimethyltransferase
LEEESVKFAVSKNVFYNPHMRFCRSFASLAVGAAGDELEVVDAFCASGIRGIRYARENRNVKRTTFIDIEPSAIALAKKNARANKIRSDALEGNVSRLAFGQSADFLEIDPFGTPSPYLVDAFRFFNPKKVAYLSVTATDVAVLCGGKEAPCMKNYHSRPLNNEFTHETGLRIIIKKVAETAAEFNMGIEPLVSLSDRHYLKTIVRVRRSAELAYESMKKLGYISCCPSCGWRGSSQFPVPACQFCGSTSRAPGSRAGNPKPEILFAGPLWLGELHDAPFVRRMGKLNGGREYSDKERLAKMLALIEGEVGMPPFYYNIHALCKRYGMGSVPKSGDVLAALAERGHVARRTHFSDVSIKSDAPYRDILDAIGWKG